jgi:hypothetical protein
MISFKIRSDITIKSNFKEYTYDDLSQAVSYWQNYIVRIGYSAPVAIVYSQISFSSIALLLALYKSQKNFIQLSGLDKALKKDPRRDFLTELGLCAIFIAGDTTHDPRYLTMPGHFVRTDSWEHGCAIGKWHGRTELEIPFTDHHKVSCQTSGSTGEPKISSMPAACEATSIQTAIDLFFEADDYCLFYHDMNHRGVHTTAILPALFTVKTFSIGSNQTWDLEIDKATHIQYFSIMENRFRLPKKIRMITTGGEKLKGILSNKIFVECECEHFYDIYGLSEALPPLAIREIKSPNSLEDPFVWVNHQYSYAVNDLNRLLITRPDGVIIDAGDRVSSTPNGILFIGRDTAQIRCDGVLIAVEDFKNEFELETGITNYVLKMHDDRAVLYAQKKDADVINQFITNNNLEITLDFDSPINTAGGIKFVV